MKRVGHKGADHVAPGNTFESFSAALEAGVDMIEFDVLRLRDGRLVLAHDYEDAARREPATLEEGLDHFAGEAYAAVELDVDMKLPGYEREVIEGLARRGLSERSLVSSHYLESLERVSELAPGMRRGWSVPRVRRDYMRSPLAPVAWLIARVWRARLPRQGGRSRPGRADRRRDGALDPRVARASCGGSRRRAARSTSGRLTTRAGSAAWRSSAWTA